MTPIISVTTNNNINRPRLDGTSDPSTQLIAEGENEVKNDPRKTEKRYSNGRSEAREASVSLDSVVVSEGRAASGPTKE